MLISERIFDLIKIQGMTQREFSEKTGIAQSTISDWKRRKTNPASEKIMIICSVLNVSPEELLSGTDGEGMRSHASDVIIVGKKTELGEFLIGFQKMDKKMQERIMGYYQALKEL